MKKVLLATTALVFTAGFAAAEVTVSGSANAGLKYSDLDESLGNTESTQLYYEFDFGVTGKTTTDGGVTIGASFDLDLDVNKQSDLIDDPEFFVSIGGVTVTVGPVDGAETVVIGGFSDIGFDGIGIDDTATTFFDEGTQNVQVKAALGAVTVAASGNLADSEAAPSDDYAVGASYDAGMATVGAAVYELSGDSIFALGGTITAAGADVELFYHKNDDADIAGYGGSVAYPLGALTLQAAVGATDIDNDEVDFGIGASYDLGGGVAVAGGVGQIDDAFADDDSWTVAEVGITAKF